MGRTPGDRRLTWNSGNDKLNSVHPDPQSYEGEKKECCFKLPCFGALCYAVIIIT